MLKAEAVYKASAEDLNQQCQHTYGRRFDESELFVDSSVQSVQIPWIDDEGISEGTQRWIEGHKHPITLQPSIAPLLQDLFLRGQLPGPGKYTIISED